MNREIINLQRKLEDLYYQSKYDSLPVAINKVLSDQSIDDKTKIERINVYIENYFDEIKFSLDDVL